MMIDFKKILKLGKYSWFDWRWIKP